MRCQVKLSMLWMPGAARAGVDQESAEPRLESIGVS